MMSRSHRALIVRTVIDRSLAGAPHFVDPARRLRSGAWLLKRSWRHPHRLPAGWRSEQFADAVDAIRLQLVPIRTLGGLVDSFAREGMHIETRAASAPPPTSMVRRRTRPSSPLEVAYLARWIELDAGTTLGAWRHMCDGAAPSA
jgi:hypothetical protein